MAIIEKASLEGLTVYLSPYLKKEYGIIFCLTNRYGGCSKGRFESLNVDYYTDDSKTNVKKNRAIILEKLGINNAGRIYSVKQVHGNSILNINDYIKLNFDNITGEVDCLITNLKNTPVMVMGADCNLILIADIEKRVVAAVHAGWKGTLKEITTKTILYMKKEFKSKVDDIIAVFGPSIRKCCYIVDELTLKKFIEMFGYGDFFSVNDNKIFLDLVGINYIQLREAGINEKNISDCGECTYCNHNFYSYRRSKITGRQAAVAVIL